LLEEEGGEGFGKLRSDIRRRANVRFGSVPVVAGQYLVGPETICGAPAVGHEAREPIEIDEVDQGFLARGWSGRS